MTESNQNITVTYETDGSITVPDTTPLTDKLQHVETQKALLDSLDPELVGADFIDKLKASLDSSVPEAWASPSEIDKLESELIQVEDANDNAKYTFLHAAGIPSPDELKEKVDYLMNPPESGSLIKVKDAEERVQKAFIDMMMTDKRIIAINGLIGAGKDTIADFLVENHGYTKINFADKLKDSVAFMFGLDRALLEGNTSEGRIWREAKLEFWSNEMKIDVTPRYLLQIYGTECMRNGFYNDVWVAFVKEEILKNPKKKYVIPDARFVNEGRMVKSLGGTVWRVKRGDDPEWIAAAEKINWAEWNNHSVGDDSNPFLNGTYEVHPSERGMMGFSFDDTIENEADFNTLYSVVMKSMM
ncbi:hypothetical protein KAU11_12645, partial [Candidatus Babeliales bacterium]|nr:hypothetical protein [Candidatus Babeliales bacterium]